MIVIESRGITETIRLTKLSNYTTIDGLRSQNVVLNIGN